MGGRWYVARREDWEGEREREDGGKKEGRKREERREEGRERERALL